MADLGLLTAKRPCYHLIIKPIPHQAVELVSFPLYPNITFSSCPGSNNETLRKKTNSTFGD